MKKETETAKEIENNKEVYQEKQIQDISNNYRKQQILSTSQEDIEVELPNLKFPDIYINTDIILKDLETLKFK